MLLRCPRCPLQSRTACPPRRIPSRGIHASPALQSRYRGLFKHGTLREWALRMEQKKLDALFYKKREPMPREAQALMLRADKVVAGHLALEAKRNKRLNPAVLSAADALHSNGMLPVLHSRILGVSSLLQRRIYRTSDKLDEVLRTPPPALYDEVGWGLRAPKPKPPPAYPPASPTSPPLPRRARRPPLMRAFPGIGGGLPFSLQHAQAAAAGLLGGAASGRPPPPPVANVAPNPVVGVGEGQSVFMRRVPARARPPMTTAGTALNWFKGSKKRKRYMMPYYASTPEPPPPLPRVEPAGGTAPVACECAARAPCGADTALVVDRRTSCVISGPSTLVGRWRLVDGAAGADEQVSWLRAVHAVLSPSTACPAQDTPSGSSTTYTAPPTPIGRTCGDRRQESRSFARRSRCTDRSYHTIRNEFLVRYYARPNRIECPTRNL
ncbi:hypothetical protein FB451DRAFT_1568559 [Mycena latifolia]|nr:hypothetical protein FB451DRAFT_1568559 [Mycena latifolia]